jgi:hypothetical protein
VASRLTRARIVAVAVALAVVGITYYRIWFGVDLTDESFYVALAWRFAVGAKPFVDETTVAQQAALLVFPFVWIWRELAGIDGVVLFVRHLQFLLSLLVGGAVFVSLRRALKSGSAALLCASTAVAFVPFDIHSLSYNTIGGGLFAAGLLLAYLQSSRAWLVVAGVCHGLAVFAYPSLAVAVIVCFALRIVLEPARWRREVVAYGVPALVVAAAAFGSILAEAGLHDVVTGYHRSSDYLGHAGGIGKIGNVFSHEASTLHFWWLVLPALVLLGVLWFTHRRLAPVVLLPLPLLALPGSLSNSFASPPYTATLEYVSHYGALALPLLVLVWPRAAARRLFVAVWIPSLVAGFATAYSSNNGAVNFGIGFFPATLVTTAFLLWSLQDAGLEVAALVPAVVVPVLLVVFGGQIYRDGPFSTMTTAAAGPYAGIRTSLNKKLFLDQFRRDLARHAPGCRIAFLRDFPAGYLLAPQRPDTNTVWIATVAQSKTNAYQQTVVDYWQRHGLPDLLVLVHRIPYSARKAARAEHYRQNTPLLETLTRSYRLVGTHYNYDLYERLSSSC